MGSESHKMLILLNYRKIHVKVFFVTTDQREYSHKVIISTTLAI